MAEIARVVRPAPVGVARLLIASALTVVILGAAGCGDPDDPSSSDVPAAAREWVERLDEVDEAFAYIGLMLLDGDLPIEDRLRALADLAMPLQGCAAAATEVGPSLEVDAGPFVDCMFELAPTGLSRLARGARVNLRAPRLAAQLDLASEVVGTAGTAGGLTEILVAARQRRDLGGLRFDPNLRPPFCPPDPVADSALCRFGDAVPTVEERLFEVGSWTDDCRTVDCPTTASLNRAIRRPASGSVSRRDEPSRSWSRTSADDVRRGGGGGAAYAGPVTGRGAAW